MTAFDRHIGHRRHFNEAQLRELLEQAGLHVERTAAAGFPFFNLYRLVVLFRGSRVVEDAVRRQMRPSRAARAAMSVFRPLFRLNTTVTPWGWQIVGVARVPEA